MRVRRITAGLSLAFVSSAVGCVHYYPAAVSSTSVGSKHEVPVRVADGHSSAYYVLGLGPTGDDSLRAAVDDALRHGKADTLANVFVDRKMTCFPLCLLPLITRIDTMVRGTLVRYVDIAEQVPALTHAPPKSTAAETPKAADPSLILDFSKPRKGAAIRLTRIDGSQFVGTYHALDREDRRGTGIVVRPPGGGYFSEQFIRLRDIQSATLAEP